MHANATDGLADMQWLRRLQAEAWGGQPVAKGAYLHLAQPSAEGAATSDAAQVVAVIDVVGVPDAAMAGLNVLLLGW